MASRSSTCGRRSPGRPRSRLPRVPTSRSCRSGLPAKWWRAGSRGSPADGMLSRTVVVAAALLLAAATPAHAAPIESLDHPGKESFYAFVNRADVARAQPKQSAKAVAKLTLRSPEKTDDLVRVLSRTVID